MNALPQKTLQDERNPTTALERGERAALSDFLVAPESIDLALLDTLLTR